MKLAPQVTQLKKRQRFPKALVIKPLMQLNGYRDDDEDSLISENDNYDNDNKHIPTKFAVDRMASNGKSVLYTSYLDKDSDVIAYCFLDGDNNKQDRHRDWKQARIVDMIWWKSINQFVCATEDAIYTISFRNAKFKILRVLRGNWSHVRLAANANNMFSHCISTNNDVNEILVCTPFFRIIKVFNTSIDRYLSTSSSFCVTNTFLASIRIPFHNHQKLFQVNFFDLNMNAMTWVPLGRCNDSVEIRSDEKDLVFITSGRRKLHIVSPNGATNTVDLENDGDCIAVLDNRRILLSKARDSMETVNY
jgi:hypothetical protein